MHGSIHLFVALPISMVQEGLRKRLILPGSQYPDHVLHPFTGPAPPLLFHAIAVEPVIRFCSTQVDFCMDATLAQAWDIGSISFQIALLFVYLLQIRLCSGAAPGIVHPYGNPFHNIVGLVKLSDHTVYQFPLAEAEPGPDLFMYMIAVAEVLVRQADWLRASASPAYAPWLIPTCESSDSHRQQTTFAAFPPYFLMGSIL